MDANTLALINSLRNKIRQLERKQREKLTESKETLEQEVNNYTEQLGQQAKGNRLLEEMIAQIRQSLNIQRILNTTAQQVKAFLNVEQVLIYHYCGSGQWEIRARGNEQKVEENWNKQISQLTQKQATIAHSSQESYCPSELIIPLEQGNHELWGCIYAYEQNRSRHWSSLEIEL